MKEPFEPIPPDEVREHANYQEAAHAAGIPAPAVLRAGDGDAFAELAGVQVRVFEWVDLRERDPNVDPAEVGRIVAVYPPPGLPRTSPDRSLVHQGHRE